MDTVSVTGVRMEVAAATAEAVEEDVVDVEEGLDLVFLFAGGVAAAVVAASDCCKAVGGEARSKAFLLRVVGAVMEV
jgi:hypothetical protein